ncbi:DUF2207 domain-containing protein [Nocardia panacis]|uniref:DUF2207 domain-containing protein n=1 Tax=Nocardia panacis TaxID=2340916 RepID=A0A3A4KSW7_9NOCA|nr:DUF2207 domain-containing protein [Nocardia panacis]RJO77990.1 DUF2207 domain-containing protein [Nocardia panacis]
MLTFRGAAAGVLMLAAGLLGTAPVAGAQAEGIAVVADLTLDRAGVLRVVETVKVPEGGEFRMSIPLRLALPGDTERVFKVTDVDTKGSGTATVLADRFSIEAKPGESTFTYAVHNTVSDAPGSQLFHYVGVIGEDLASIQASVLSPDYRIAILDCKLGPPGNGRDCANIHTEVDGTVYLDQSDLHKGDAIDLTLQLPPGTVPANADVRAAGNTGVFALTAPVLAAFGVLLAVLAGLVGFVLWSRRQNAAATSGSSTLDPLREQGERVEFASPDGILPGAAGLVLDEQVDPVDIAATVVDLAVRRYLWIAPLGERDWRITRVNQADEQLRDYERAVYLALLPEGTDSVTLSELGAPGRVRSTEIRSAMFADGVAEGVLVDRRKPGPWMWLGGGLIGVGLIAAVALALTAGYALVGVAIALAGVAVLLLPRSLPARTARGREVTDRVRALQRGLEEVRPEAIPPADRELVFSRALPFTLLGGRADNWIRTFRDLDPAAAPQPGLYWFGGHERDRTLQRFGGQFPYFITALEALFAADK